LDRISIEVGNTLVDRRPETNQGKLLTWASIERRFRVECPIFPDIEASLPAEIMDVELDVAHEVWNSGHNPTPARIRWPQNLRAV
jgi:hypothetical protein